MIPAILQPEAFDAALKAQLESEITVYPARAWYPSQIGHPCDRFLVWSFTRWKDKARHDWVLQSIFGEGNMHQPAVYKRLEAMGFECIREGDRPVQHKLKGGAVISGRGDGAFRGYKGVRFEQPIGLEIKSMADHIWKRIDTLDDILNYSEHYIRGYYTQANTVAFLEERPATSLVLKSKSTGLLKIITWELDFENAEATLQRIEKLQPMVEGNVDPPPIMFGKPCERCAFRLQCYPPRSMGEGVDIIEDTDLADDIEAREQLRASKSSYDALDKSIKKKLKALGVAQGICGNFLITSTTRDVKGFTVQARTDRIYDFQPLDIGKIENA